MLQVMLSTLADIVFRAKFLRLSGGQLPGSPGMVTIRTFAEFIRWRPARKTQNVKVTIFTRVITVLYPISLLNYVHACTTVVVQTAESTGALYRRQMLPVQAHMQARELPCCLESPPPPISRSFLLAELHLPMHHVVRLSGSSTLRNTNTAKTEGLIFFELLNPFWVISVTLVPHSLSRNAVCNLTVRDI